MQLKSHFASSVRKRVKKRFLKTIPIEFARRKLIGANNMDYEYIYTVAIVIEL